jgi:hypothetical protein
LSFLSLFSDYFSAAQLYRIESDPYECENGRNVEGSSRDEVWVFTLVLSLRESTETQSVYPASGERESAKNRDITVVIGSIVRLCVIIS